MLPRADLFGCASGSWSGVQHRAKRFGQHLDRGVETARRVDEPKANPAGIPDWTPAHWRGQ